MFPYRNGGAIVDGVTKLRQSHVQFVHLGELLARLPLALNPGLLLFGSSFRVGCGKGRKRKKERGRKKEEGRKEEEERKRKKEEERKRKKERRKKEEEIKMKK